MEGCGLGETGEFAEGYLGKVLRECVDGHGAALSRGRYRCEMVSSPVPVDDLDCRPDSYPDQHSFVLQFGSWASPLRGRLFASWDAVMLLSVCSISEARRQDVTAGLV